VHSELNLSSIYYFAAIITMHPFGGTSKCPRCEKVVYAAEQVMGPGRKLYHKPCLSCTTCKKRLDAFSLVEHDQEPYCKLCHVKNFGTRDLRQANLPNRDEVFGLSPTKSDYSPPSSPLKFDAPVSSPPVRRHMTGGLVDRRTNYAPYSPLLRPNKNISSPGVNAVPDGDPSGEEADELSSVSYTNTGRGPGGLPRTVPLPPSSGKIPTHTTGGRVGSKSVDWTPGSRYPATMGRSNSAATTSDQVLPALMSTATGTRYGAALTGNSNAGTRQWGGGTPVCPSCDKSVFFAEQVKAIGKTYHKACLRCSECSIVLDSARLSERDGSPFCNRCYGKLYGPQGSGYALLGKAGG